MMKNMYGLAAALLFAAVILLHAGVVRADNIGATPDWQLTEGDKSFYAEMRAAAYKNDKAWFANHIHVPLMTVLDGKHAQIFTKKEFLDRYDDIFNAYVIDQIKKHKAKTIRAAATALPSRAASCGSASSPRSTARARNTTS